MRTEQTHVPPAAPAPPEGGLRPWHAISPETVCHFLSCTPNGLREEEARERLARDGPNRMPETPPPSAALILLRQFKSPLIYILMVAAAVSLALGLLDDAAFILGVLVLNAVIGFIQEYRAERDIQNLGRLIRSVVRVQRGGRTREVPSEGLVAGDLVLLESGMRVAADMRLLEARGMRVDESMLTGESLPSEKAADPGLPEATPLGDQKNMLFSGTTVFQGRGNALVVATALNSQIGQIALALRERKEMKPPLIVRMERFSRLIGAFVLGLCGVIFLLGLYHNIPWIEILMSALALSVSAIPEGLPVAMTVALAIGVKRMVGRNVLVRHLESVEGLGSCSVIGTDKTGTLTKNQLTVIEGVVGGGPFQVTGVGYSPVGEVLRGQERMLTRDHPLLDRLVRAGALCNEGSLAAQDDTWSWDGDPTDVALLSLAGKAGAPSDTHEHRFLRTNAIPFEPERRYAARFHRGGTEPDAGGLVVVKGAPERVFDMCTAMWLEGEAAPVTFDRGRALAWERGLVSEGYRVLALAEREDAAFLDSSVTPDEPAGLTLIGLIGMTDPPRDGVSDSIAACHVAGIKVVMITGDHLETARVIAGRIGLAQEAEAAVECRTLSGLDDAAFAREAGRYTVFARATPTDKLHIVHALQMQGEFVAVTGDGVNDAPALRAANIGVAMGRSGTDIARDAAGLVITDDDFSSIVAGVEEGRATYDNVRKVIYLLVSTGLGEVMLVMLTMLLGMPVPFLPAQLLWLNLVTNGIQDVALAFEPKERGLLERQPRPPKEQIFNRLMIERTVLASLVFGFVGLGVYHWVLGHGASLGEARNMVLNLFVLFEIFHLANSRSEYISYLRISPFSNRLLFVGTLCAMAVHGAALYWAPLQGVLGTAPLGLGQWQLLVASAAVILVVMEAHKLFRNLRPIRQRRAA